MSRFQIPNFRKSQLSIAQFLAVDGRTDADILNTPSIVLFPFSWSHWWISTVLYFFFSIDQTLIPTLSFQEMMLRLQSSPPWTSPQVSRLNRISSSKRLVQTANFACIFLSSLSISFFFFGFRISWINI